MKETVTVQRYECDGCGKVVLTEGGELPDGYHGKAFETGSWGGGPDVYWFACKQECIRKAVLGAIARELEEQRH